MVTVRLQYGGLRVENQAHTEEIAEVAERMATRHGVKVSTRLEHNGQRVPSRGRVELTGAKAQFTVVTDAGVDWFDAL